MIKKYAGFVHVRPKIKEKEGVEKPQKDRPREEGRGGSSMENVYQRGGRSRLASKRNKRPRNIQAG